MTDKTYLEKDSLERHDTKADLSDIRTEVHEGDKHLVVPTVVLKEEVLKGQFLPGREIENSKNLWSDVPVPIGHPKNRSARERNIVDKRSVGRFYQPQITSNESKLKGEIWINQRKVKNYMGDKAQEAFDKLRKGEWLDVSTSYWHDTLNERGEYNNQDYKGKQVNLRPDHLAILVDEFGELSKRDGVGAPKKNQWGGSSVKTENVRSTARDPAFSETSEGSWERQGLEEFGRQRGWDMDEINSVDDLTQNQRETAAESSLSGEVDGDTWGEVTFFQVVDGNGTLYKNALIAVRSGRGQSADISQAAYESASQKAKTLLEEEFDVEYEENKANLWSKMANIFTNAFRGEANMEKQKVVDEILELAEEPPAEGNLLDMSETNLKAMRDGLEATEDNSEDEPDEDETQDNKTDNEEDVIKFNSEEELKEFVRKEAKKANNEDKREEIVNKLDNSDKIDLSREKLEDTPLEALEQMQKQAFPGKRIGQGGVLETESTDNSGVQTIESKGVLLRNEEGDE